MKIIRKIKCKLGWHDYDFGKCPIETRDIFYDGKPAYLFTVKCPHCGNIRHDITIRSENGGVSIHDVKDLSLVSQSGDPFFDWSWLLEEGGDKK